MDTCVVSRVTDVETAMEVETALKVATRPCFYSHGCSCRHGRVAGCGGICEAWMQSHPQQEGSSLLQKSATGVGSSARNGQYCAQP